MWIGSDDRKKNDAILCIVDAMKRNTKIKILIGYTEEKDIKEKLHAFDSNGLLGIVKRYVFHTMIKTGKSRKRNCA